MKLIDMLVKELPKRGGWPDGAVECCRHYGSNSIDFYDETGNWDDDCYLKYGKDFAKDCIYEETSESRLLQSISLSEYVSALAASLKPAWNGEGLPPVGCECELKYKCHDDDAYWERVVILWQRGDDTIVEYVGDHFKNTAQLIHKTSMHVDFRPLRTEKERKRDIAVKVIKGLLMFDYGDDPRVNDATFIYDAIAAGKITGVKLDD